MHTKFGDIVCGVEGVKGYVSPSIEEQIKLGKKVAEEYNSNDKD